MKINLIILVLGLVLAACTLEKGCEPFVVSATANFEKVEIPGFVPYYVHDNLNALAINSLEYNSAFAIAAHIFNANSGIYNIKITTILEDDGEPVYQLLINGKLVALVQNEETEDNFIPKIYEFGDFKLKKGDIISIAFNATTNGKMPEGEYTAYARGRWQNLIFSRICE